MTLDGRQSLSRTHIAIRPTDALYLVLTRDSAWPRRAQRAADSPAAIVHPAAIWSRRVSRGWRCAREDEQQAATRWTARQPDSQTASHTSYSHTNTQPDRHTQRPSHSHARPHARTHTHTALLFRLVRQTRALQGLAVHWAKQSSAPGCAWAPSCCCTPPRRPSPNTLPPQSHALAQG